MNVLFVNSIFFYISLDMSEEVNLSTTLTLKLLVFQVLQGFVFFIFQFRVIYTVIVIFLWGLPDMLAQNNTILKLFGLWCTMGF